MKLKKLLLIIVFTIYTISASVQAVFADDTDILELPKFPEISSNYIVLMDADNGELLYQSNANEKCYPASTTKLLTALLTIESSSLSEKVTFSDAAVHSIESGDANASLSVGEEMTVEQALYCLILRSANDVAYGLAESVAGTESGFASLMNNRMDELGAVNSHFTNASGLTDEFHYTTPYDMALIARACFNNKSLMKIMSYSGLYTIPPTNKSKFTRYYKHRYQMLQGGDYAYQYSCGGKTGFTTAAKSCLVSFAEKDDLRLICVVMKGDDKLRYTDTTALFDYYFNNYKKIDLSGYDNAISSSNTDVVNIAKSLDDNSNINIGFEDGVYLLVPNKVNLSDLTGIVTYRDNPAYIGKEDGFACISYYYGDIDVGNVTIYVTNSAVSLSQSHPKTIYVNVFYIVGCVIFISGVTTFIIMWSRRKHRRHSYGSKRLHF